MIPLKLELSNFLSYRSHTVLDFHGINLACISGANGAGKSSILDAITWTLFGRSRSRSDDDVVNRSAVIDGQSAEVKLSFELEGVTYRIVRRKKAGKTMILEFQVADNKGGWKSLSEGRLRETQEAIESLLKMSFATFINASFLLQGKADEFTTKTPNKRKEILAELLGVSEWDSYKEMVTNRRKETESRLLLFDSQLKEIDLELDEKPEREEALVSARKSLGQISNQHKIQETSLKERRRIEATIEHQKQNVAALTNNLDRAKQRFAKMQRMLQERQLQRDATKILLSEAEIIKAGYDDWKKADSSLRVWQEKSAQFQDLQKQMRPHELALERERSRLTQRKLELENRSSRISAMVDERVTVAETVHQLQLRLSELDSDLEELRAGEQQWRSATSSLQKLEAARDLLTAEVKRVREQAKNIMALEAEKIVVNNNLKQAQTTFQDVGARLTLAGEQNRRLMQIMAEYDARKAEQTGLRKKMAEHKDRMERLEIETGGQCPLCDQPLSEDHRSKVLGRLNVEGKEMGDRFRENQQDFGLLSAKIDSLQSDVKQRGRLERDHQAQQQRLATAQARLQEIERSMAEWSAKGAGELIELENRLADETDIRTQKELVSELEGLTKNKQELETSRQQSHRQLSQSEACIAEIDRSVVEWHGPEDDPAAGLAADLETVTTQLSQGDIAPIAQRALEAYQLQIEALGYESEEHQSAQIRRDELEDAQTRFQELQQAQAALEPLQKSVEDLIFQVVEQEEAVSDLAQQHEQSTLHLKTLEDGVSDLSILVQEVNRLREEEITAHRRVATAEQSVAVLNDLHRQREKISTDRIEATVLIQRTKLLEKACGREGVQSLLIERALPEIEDDTNELLDRLTGGQMQVIFDTQRKLKSSDRVAETLDIRIADNAGERPYENFSGGEQFRINFAIRLALSKILTKRAGARLQTLVIDEGFGSQDPEGRQRLIEAINAIQDDFERILVITHIDEMRNVFPAQIFVEKGTSGSTIQVT